MANGKFSQTASSIATGILTGLNLLQQNKIAEANRKFQEAGSLRELREAEIRLEREKSQISNMQKQQKLEGELNNLRAEVLQQNRLRALEGAAAQQPSATQLEIAQDERMMDILRNNAAATQPLNPSAMGGANAVFQQMRGRRAGVDERIAALSHLGASGPVIEKRLQGQGVPGFESQAQQDAQAIAMRSRAVAAMGLSGTPEVNEYVLTGDMTRFAPRAQRAVSDFMQRVNALRQNNPNLTMEEAFALASQSMRESTRERPPAGPIDRISDDKLVGAVEQLRSTITQGGGLFPGGQPGVFGSGKAGREEILNAGRALRTVLSTISNVAGREQEYLAPLLSDAGFMDRLRSMDATTRDDLLKIVPELRVIMQHGRIPITAEELSNEVNNAIGEGQSRRQQGAQTGRNLLNSRFLRGMGRVIAEGL